MSPIVIKAASVDATTAAARARVDSDSDSDSDSDRDSDSDSDIESDRPTVKRGRAAPIPRRQDAGVQPARLKPSRLRLRETRSEYADDLMQGTAGVIQGTRRITAIVDGLAKHLGLKMALKKCFTGALWANHQTGCINGGCDNEEGRRRNGMEIRL